MWNRSYIPKLSTEELPWLPMESIASGISPGSSVRVLSRDLADGAGTFLWRVPPGWRQAAPFALQGGEELFVIDGSLCKGEHLYGRRCYAYRPPGYVHEPMHSETGATVLVMWNGSPQLRRPERNARCVEEPILKIDTLAVEAVPSAVEGPRPGIMVKVLRRFEQTGGMTFLIDIAAGWSEERSEHHDCVEESFKFGGEIDIVENGHPQTLGAGDYFFRPPRIKHGPMHTREGTASLIRFSATPVNHYGPLDRC